MCPSSGKNRSVALPSMLWIAANAHGFVTAFIKCLSNDKCSSVMALIASDEMALFVRHVFIGWGVCIRVLPSSALDGDAQQMLDEYHANSQNSSE